MSELPTTLSPTQQARIKLQAYTAEIRLINLAIGIDNIHYDVFLSPRFVEFTRKHLLDLVRQAANVKTFYGMDARSSKPPETAAFRKLLTELLQASLTRAKFEKNIEIDLLLRLALIEFLNREITNQFSSLIVECKEWIRGRGEHFEHSEQAHVLRAKIADLQANRKNIHRQIGQALYQVLRELEETRLSQSRRALFGDDFSDTYDLLQNRMLFVEGGSDEMLFLEHYVMLASFLNDQDRFEVFDGMLLDFVRDFVTAEDPGEEAAKARKHSDRLMEQALALRSEMARVEEERDEVLRKTGGAEELFAWPWKHRAEAPPGSEKGLSDVNQRLAALQKNLANLGPQLEASRQKVDFLAEESRVRLGDFLNEPENARRLFDAKAADEDATPETRERLLEEWISRLEERDLLVHVLASYEMRNLHLEYCPPVHLQQLKKALVVKDELKRVEQILNQFPARSFSMKRIEETARSLRRYPREESRAVALRFAEDLMRLRRDRRDYQHVTTWMERIYLVRSERTRQLSRENRSLYEYLLPEEARPADDPVVTHAVIKADVRGSTQITKHLLSRGLNPASHFSLNLYEPVKRILERYGAAKVFLEGDAIILAIYETESTRASQRAVAKACILGREILAVADAYNQRAVSEDLPRLELGIGVAFQNSAPAVWMDGDSRLMISKAINHSDRLASCSKTARRLIAKNPSPFNVFLLETVVDGADADEGDELLLRFNLNGVNLNEEGFAKLAAEISLSPLEGTFSMPWGKERVQLFFGEVPIGESLEPIVVRRGLARQLLPGGKIGGPSARAYYEICTNPKLVELARKKVAAASSSAS
jgi:hypothetical protein